MLRSALLFVLFGLIALGASHAQEIKKDDPKKDDPPGKLKGFLPPNFKKIGLSSDQVQQIYKIQADYKAKKDDLKRKLDNLKTEEKDSIDKVLTPDQLKRLKAILLGDKGDK